MTLRKMMTERILFSLAEEDLAVEFNLTLEELEGLSDLDFLELFEEVTGFQG